MTFSMQKPDREPAWRPREGEPAWHAPTARWALVREVDARVDPMECRITLDTGVFLTCPASALQAAPTPAVDAGQLRVALGIWRNSQKTGVKP